MPLPPIPLSHLTGPSRPERKYRLMEKVRRCLRERRFSVRTENAYVHWIRRFIIFHDRRHPKDMGAEEVRRFLGDLAVNQKVAASTQNQALAAIMFLYTHVLGRPLERVEGIEPAHRAVRTKRKSPLRRDRRGLSGVLAALDGSQTSGTTLPSRLGQA